MTAYARFVGGPYDDHVMALPNLMPEVYVAKAASIDFRVHPEKETPTIDIRKGTYEPTSFEDEDGNVLYFWKGWFPTSEESE